MVSKGPGRQPETLAKTCLELSLWPTLMGPAASPSPLVQALLDLFRCSSATQSCPTLCDPRDCSTPGLPVHHQLPEFTQTRVHRVHDAIQPSHPLSSPSPPAFNLSQYLVFSNDLALHIRWPKYWSFSSSISSSSEY